MARSAVTGVVADVDVAVGALLLRAAFDVGEGRTVAVVGPNGAGKTTLLRAIAGLQPIDRGSITIDGSVVDDPATRSWVAPDRRSVGFVHQDHALFPHLSARDNVAFGPRANGLSRRDARLVAADWLGRVGLADAAPLRPRQLSGGMAQRVALARALARSPRVLLLDEPLSALDASTRVETRRMLRLHLDAHEGARVVVTHDVVDAMALADELVVLEEGKVVQRGTPSEIARAPRSRYVADLVGVNLLAGAVRAAVLDAGDGVAVASADTVPDGHAFAVIHPRSVALHLAAPEGSPRNVWRGQVRAIDRETDRARVVVAIAPAVAIVAEVTAAAMSELALADGLDVWVSVKATEVTLVAR